MGASVGASSNPVDNAHNICQGQLVGMASAAWTVGDSPASIFRTPPLGSPSRVEAVPIVDQAQRQRYVSLG